MLNGAIIVFDDFIPSPTELVPNEYNALNDVFDSAEYSIVSRAGPAVAIQFVTQRLG